MTRATNEKMLRKFRILVAPLDWGLGHASRCIPVVKELLANDCEVWLAGEGQQESLLRSEFPSLPFLHLPGYRIRYSKKNLTLKIISQAASILFQIRKEHAWLKKAAIIHNFDAVISDNRFGLYTNKIPAVFITHQLNIKGGLGKWSEKILRDWNYRFINRFSECWIPDSARSPNLAGELSHPSIKPSTPVTYLGWLSRFEKGEDESTALSAGNDDHLIFILSGPEPQRSILENKIINDVSHYSGTATVVRGLPGSLSAIPSTGMIRFYNHLDTRELSEEIKKADWVISRCGYSTVMDIVALKKKAILIPTPGQTEQEYLARHLQGLQVAPVIEQSDFSVDRILSEAKIFNYQIPTFGENNHLSAAIQNFLLRLKR